MITEIILTFLLSLFFILGGMIKVFSVPKKLYLLQEQEYFKKFGIGRGGIRTVGMFELLGAIALLPLTSFISLIGAVLIMIACLVDIKYKVKYQMVLESGPTFGALILSGVLISMKLASLGS